MVMIIMIVMIVIIVIIVMIIMIIMIPNHLLHLCKVVDQQDIDALPSVLEISTGVFKA